MPKGKTPSLIGSSLGRPAKVKCGRAGPCSRCEGEISKGDDCYDVPQPLKPHSATRRFCGMCMQKVLEQSKADFQELETLLK